MSRPVVSVTVYQYDNIPHNPPIVMLIPINSKTVVAPCSNNNPQTKAYGTMQGSDGDAPHKSIAPYVYSVIAMPRPSNSGILSVFVSETVAAIYSAIGT